MQTVSPITNISTVACRGLILVTRARTTASTSGSSVEMVDVLDVASERTTESVGRAFLLPLIRLRRLTCPDGVAVVVVGRGGAVSRTEPSADAHIWPLWMCVPGPGEYLEVGPSGWPGRAVMVGGIPSMTTSTDYTGLESGTGWQILKLRIVNQFTGPSIIIPSVNPSFIF